MISTEEHHLTKRDLMILIAVICMAVAPHFTHTTIWVTLFFIATLCYRMIAVRLPQLLPGKLLLFLITIAQGSGEQFIYFQF